MTDFSASRLERIAASAYDLVANAFLSEPSAAGLQGQKEEPVCTEPFCGGFYWEANEHWAPEAAPPLGAMPKKGQGEHPAGDPDVAPPKAKTPYQKVSDYMASKPLDKLDLTGARVFLPLDKPVAKQVQLLPANKDEWQWWLAENSRKIKLGAGKHGKPNIEVGNRHRDKLMDHLTPFLRLDDDVQIADFPTIPKGSQLLSVKPAKKPLRVAPWIGSREQLRKESFPLELTFGKPTRPDGPNWMPNYDQPKGGKGEVVGGPLPERPVQAPIVLPVKRLDVLLKRPRDELSDFLPPLLAHTEPGMEHPEMEEEEM
jgi:hypothetical protein